MDQNNRSIFSLELDQQSLQSLNETARWSKFLAIVWFIVCGLSVILFLLALVLTTSLYTRRTPIDILEGVTGLIMILVLIAIEVVPNVFRYKFADKMIKAIRISDQQLLTESLNNLRNFNRYWGIVTIIIVAFYVIFFVIMLFGLLVQASL